MFAKVKRQLGFMLLYLILPFPKSLGVGSGVSRAQHGWFCEARLLVLSGFGGWFFFAMPKIVDVKQIIGRGMN